MVWKNTHVLASTWSSINTCRVFSSVTLHLISFRQILSLKLKLIELVDFFWLGWFSWRLPEFTCLISQCWDSTAMLGFVWMLWIGEQTLFDGKSLLSRFKSPAQDYYNYKVMVLSSWKLIVKLESASFVFMIYAKLKIRKGNIWGLILKTYVFLKNIRSVSHRLGHTFITFPFTVISVQLELWRCIDSDFGWLWYVTFILSFFLIRKILKLPHNIATILCSPIHFFT